MLTVLPFTFFVDVQRKPKTLARENCTLVTKQRQTCMDSRAKLRHAYLREQPTHDFGANNGVAVTP